MLSEQILNIQKRENKKLNILLTDLQLLQICKNIKNISNINIIPTNIFQSRSIESHYKCIPVNYQTYETYDIIITNILDYNLLKYKKFNYIFTLQKITENINFLKKINSNRAYLYKNINYIQQNIVIKNQHINNMLNKDRFNIFLQETQILIRTKDRLQYLVYTLNSLLSTKLYSSQITIVDDKSTSKKLNDFLFSNKKIQLQQIDFYQNIKNINAWNKYIGILPNLPKTVNGIKNKISVKQFQKNYGDCKGLLQTIKYGFQKNLNCNLVIILEDDILLYKDWLTKVYQIYNTFKDDNIGVISLYHNEITTNQYIYNWGLVGPAVCYTRKFYNKLKQNKIFQKEFQPCALSRQQRNKKSFLQLQKYNIAGDTHIGYYIKLFNFKNIKYKNSLVQHIGLNSILNPDLQERYTKNFIGNFQYNKNILNNIKNYKNQRILIFSNINFEKEYIDKLNIKQDDLLVFLNTAVSIKYFNQHQNKIILHRYGTLKYFGQQQTQNINCKKYALDGPNSIITQTQYNKIIKEYSKQFFSNQIVLKENNVKSYHKFRYGPTTGWLAQFLMRYRYPNSKIQLVNFFPTQDNSTAHFTGHDWKFQNQYYKNSNIKIYDLRTSFECVYLTDNNPKYIQMCKKSIDTLIKFNPNAKITIVSPQPIQIGYNNIVLSDLNNLELKQNKNDRISKTAYLKLLFTKLPFNKCMFIDPDTLINGNLYNIFIANIPYIGCTQSHNYGNIQAKQFNHQKYFLSGFMIMNLKNLRKINFYDKVMNYYSNMKKYENIKNWQHQQTILNIQFYDLITEIHRKYNYCYNRQYTNNLNDNQIILYHFPGENKQYMNIIYNKIMSKNGK